MKSLFGWENAFAVEVSKQTRSNQTCIYKLNDSDALRMQTISIL